MRQPICKWFFLLAPLAICVCLGLQHESKGAEKDTTPGAPRLLPKDTLAYIRIDNVDDMRTDMAASSMGRMMNDPKLKPFVSEVYTTLSDLFEQFGAQIGLSLEELLAIPTGQVAAAAMPANLSERDEELVEEERESDAQFETTSGTLERILEETELTNELLGGKKGKKKPEIFTQNELKQKL